MVESWWGPAEAGSHRPTEKCVWSLETLNVSESPGIWYFHQLPELISFLAKGIFSLAFSRKSHLASFHPWSPKCPRRPQLLSGLWSLFLLGPSCLLCYQSLIMYSFSGNLQKHFLIPWTRVSMASWLGLCVFLGWVQLEYTPGLLSFSHSISSQEVMWVIGLMNFREETELRSALVFSERACHRQYKF